MAQRLVGGDGHGVRKVQAAQAFAHGDAHARVGVAGEDGRIDAGALTAEQQERVGAVFDAGMQSRCRPREQVQLVASVRFEERVGACPAHDVHVVPVIAPGACEIALRVYKVDRCIARVNNPKNLRIFRKLGIECVSSTTLIGRMIEEEATLGNLNAMSTLAQGNIGIVEVKVREFRTAGLSPLNGASIYDEIDYPDEALPIAVVHDGVPQLVDEDTRVLVGDTVLVAAPTESIPDVRAAFRII